MTENILITGGAGFIGSHIVDALLERGYKVCVYDSLISQVHGGGQDIHGWPNYLANDCKKVHGDVRDRDRLLCEVKNADVIFHLAALVGVGQSMYEIENYVNTNVGGTSILLDILANELHHVRKLIVSSSMSVYGEGKYKCSEHGEVNPNLRTDAQVSKRDWELHCPFCNQSLFPISTPEEKTLCAMSVYAATKRAQEEMSLIIGHTYTLPTVVLRLFNTYGPCQSLSNPYTGLISTFLSRILSGHLPMIFEDGLQTRDFVHVQDVVQANLMAMIQEEMDYKVFNVGTGRPLTVIDIAKTLLNYFPGIDKDIKILHQYRKGDIRHCYANINRIQALGYRPHILFEDGIIDLVNWVIGQKSIDQTDNAYKQLVGRRLLS